MDWNVAYDVHGPDLLAFLRRVLGDATAAEDLLHDTFVRAIRARNQTAE